MNENFALTLIQPDIFWEDIPENLEMYSRMLNTKNEETDLVLFPEMFTTGFSMNTHKISEKTGGATMQWMKRTAAEMGCQVAGSIVISENNKFYNRIIWMREDGSFSIYDKRHLFRMGKEHLSYSPGNSKLICDVKGWKICPLICYDIRFPVWSKNRYINSQWDYDLLLYVANWPSARSNIWTTLLAARAIENQAYVAGINRVGADGNNIFYSGDSMVLDPSGNVIAKCNDNKPDVITLQLSRDELAENRSKLAVNNDWDQFVIL
jgi:omega-amidase